MMDPVSGVPNIVPYFLFRKAQNTLTRASAKHHSVQLSSVVKWIMENQSARYVQMAWA